MGIEFKQSEIDRAHYIGKSLCARVLGVLYVLAWSTNLACLRAL